MHGQTRRFSNRVVVDIEYDHEEERGVYKCRVITPEGSRRIVVVLSQSELRFTCDRLVKTAKLSSVAVSAIHFAIDEDERGEPSSDKKVNDISTLEYCVLDENGDVEVFVRRVDSPGQTVFVPYCEQRHDIRTGKPVDHQCHVFPVEAIYALAMGWGSGQVLIDSFRKGEELLVHSVVCMDEADRTIENVRFQLWFPDGPKSRSTLRLDTAMRACSMESIDIGMKRKGRRIGGFEVVSERRALVKELSPGIWR